MTQRATFYGVSGTCTPFFEIFPFAVRSLELEHAFVPHVDESQAKKIGLADDVGMQACAGPGTLKPKAVVIMRRLSMPNVSVKAELEKSVIDKYPGEAIIGVCFMHMFKKAGWLSTVSSDCMIAATIGPVTTKKVIY